MTLKNVKDWLKTVITEDASFYIGKIDASKEKVIGVYGRSDGPSPIVPLGGMENSSYAVKPISVLVHWTKNADVTENIAKVIYDLMFGQHNITINSKRVISFDMQSVEPIPVGTDSNNIFEYVIEVNLIYER